MATYFVSYFYKDEVSHGHGNIDITLDDDIDGIDDIREMEEFMKEEIGVSSLIVTGFQKLSD